MRKIENIKETKDRKKQFNIGEKEINVRIDEAKVVTYESALNVALKILEELN